MKKGKKLSILLASTMIFNLFAFPSIAGASTLGRDTIYELEGDTTTPYITEDDTKEPALQVPEAKAKTVLDIGRGNITISSGSVTGFTPSGAAATPNSAGYEIVGTTTANKVVVNNAVPIAINGVTMNYAASIANVGINMVDGGEITVLGQNNLTRANTSSSNTFIGHDSGKLIIRGNGALSISDSEDQGSTIGGNVNKAANMLIDGRVSIQITSPVANYGARIGSGYNAGNKTNTIVIGERAEVKAYNNGSSSQGAVIGSAYGGNLINDITISGDAVVWAYGGSGTSYAAVIGTWHGGSGTANIKIEDSAFVKVFNRSTFTSTGAEPAGMGFSPASITSGMINRSNVRIAPTANVEAPTRENYYKALNNSTPVYRALTQTLKPNTIVPVIYGGVTKSVLTDPAGIIYSYLPAGAQSINIDGMVFTGTVSSSGNTEMFQPKDNKKTVLDIGKQSIAITHNSVTGKTPEGVSTLVDLDGYEIVGTTTANKVVVNNAVPIAINGVNINYAIDAGGSAINMIEGGEITVLGTNTFNRTVEQVADTGFIGQDSGQLIITGTGTLNMTDHEDDGATIGGNNLKKANILIKGDVTINAHRPNNSYGAVIGGGYGSGGAIHITDNAKVNAKQDQSAISAAVIGGRNETSIRISKKAQVIATGSNSGAGGVVIGTTSSNIHNSDIIIEDEAYVKITVRNASADSDPFVAGMGLNTGSVITSGVINRSRVRIAPTANVEAPTRETYYKALNNSTPVYRATVTHLAPNTDVTMVYENKISKVRTSPEGKIYLYLPTGTQTVHIDDASQRINVNTSGTAVFALIKDDIKTVLDIGKASIKITENSVSAQIPAGVAAPFDPDGYEIIGSTETNNINVQNSVPIVLNGITMDHKTNNINYAIHMEQGGEITVLGTNTINRVDQTSNLALIGQDTGTITINGTGTLNITDGEANGVIIGGNDGKPASIAIKDSVTINATKENQSYGAVIGSGYNTDGNLKVLITDNAKVNAKIDGIDSYAAVIGRSAGETATTDITISGKAEVVATGGPGDYKAAIIGTNDNASPAVNITITDGTSVKIVDRSTAQSTNAAGIGIPADVPITSEMIARTTIKVSPRANIDAPARENYYKGPAGNAAVYKVAVQGLAPNANVSVGYGGTTQTIKTFADGGLYLYLPLNEQISDIDGDKFECLVENSESNRMFIKTILTAADISRHVSDGAVGINLRGYETTNSKAGVIKYTITDAGTTGAVMDRTTLHWNKPGTIKMNVSQAEAGKYSSASTDFTVTLTTNPGDIEVLVSVDVSSVGFGKIVAINEANKDIVPFVQPGAEITLKAIPNEGYEIAKWVRTTQATKGTKVAKTETLIATPDLRIVAKAGESYTAFFRAKPVVPGPKLSVLQVSSMVLQANGTYKEKYKPLIRQDGTEDVSFDPNRLVYGVYLRSIDSNNINVYVRHPDTKPLNVKIGKSAQTQVNPFNKHSVAITLSGKAYEEIPVVVSDGVDTTTYLLKFFKEQKVENDPHVYAELEINPIKDNLELGIYAVNVDVNAFTMTMKIDESLAADKQAFTTFVNNNGVAFNDLNTSLAGNVANYFNLDPKFEIADMRSDGKFINFTVNVKPGWGTISIGETPRKILSVSVKRNPNYTGDIIKEIDTLRMEPVLKGTSTYGNNLQSKFYGDLNDTFQANRVEDEKTLSYLVFRGKPDTIKMYVTFDANLVGRVNFEIVDVSIPNYREIVAKGAVVDQEIQEIVIKSTYRVRVLADGYLLAESEDVVYDGTPSEYGIIMTPVTLLEGDLDDTGEIDGADRAKLITVLNQNVVDAGSGFITVGNDKIYADYNDDNRINSLDLGRLVQNIGKQYSAIHRE